MKFELYPKEPKFLKLQKRRGEREGGENER
jgi:hypothetical protein